MHLSPSISRQTPRPPWRATEPAYHEARPDSALTTLIDHILESGDTRITWTLEMENGDVLRIHTDLIVTEIHEARPDSALTTLIDHILESGDTRITWTLEMENGDVLRIHTDLIVTEISTVHYRPGDAPMGTMEEL